RLPGDVKRQTPCLLYTREVTTAEREVRIRSSYTLSCERLSPAQYPEARAWAVQAAGSIRQLGLAHNAAYDLQATRLALIDALDRPTQGEVQTAAANALSVLAGPECQRAIVETACKGTVMPNVRVACFNAAAESVRRLGNLITEEQAEKVIAVVNGKDALVVREAAAKFLGALDLPSEKIKDLVLQDLR
ncbi:MAG: hypothetical protein NT031_19150, partial [Planctomycetota bacterium]|nr:hypothetical protein [Planctomycetota bacterium]